MQHQLQQSQASIGGTSCGYYWHAVVDSPPSKAEGFYQELSDDGGMVDAEASGFTGGAAYHHMVQARRLTPGVTDPPFSTGWGTSVVSLDLRCSSGPPSCAQSCQGTVQGTLDYTSVGTAESMTYATGGSATALVWEEAMLMVDANVVFQKTLYASTQGGTAQDMVSDSFAGTTAEPVTFTLSATRQLKVSAAYDTNGMPLPRLPEQGAAHGFAQAENAFKMVVEGTTPTCLNTITTKITWDWPFYERATWIKEEGGIRNPKWQFSGM